MPLAAGRRGRWEATAEAGATSGAAPPPSGSWFIHSTRLHVGAHPHPQKVVRMAAPNAPRSHATLIIPKNGSAKKAHGTRFLPIAADTRFQHCLSSTLLQAKQREPWLFGGKGARMDIHGARRQPAHFDLTHRAPLQLAMMTSKNR